MNIYTKKIDNLLSYYSDFEIRKYCNIFGRDNFDRLFDKLSKLSSDEIEIIFSQHKSFVSNERTIKKYKKYMGYNYSKNAMIISNKELNYEGLHILRSLVSESIFYNKIKKFSQLKEFKKNGFLIAKNFICTIEEFESFSADSFFKKIKNSEFNSFFEILFKNLFSKNIFVRSDIISKPYDPQTVFHTDCFHPTIKVWLYLNDVSYDDCPLQYICGSHNNSLSKLQLEFNKINKILTHPKDISVRDLEGSFRFSNQDLCENNFLKNKKVFDVKAGTLIIANTRGIHRRSPAAKGTKRCSIHGDFRVNPFYDEVFYEI